MVVAGALPFTESFGLRLASCPTDGLDGSGAVLLVEACALDAEAAVETFRTRAEAGEAADGAFDGLRRRDESIESAFAETDEDILPVELDGGA